MAITKKLSRVGKSYSVIVDKTLMQLLNITPDTLLELTTNGESLVITPVKETKAVTPTDEAFGQSVEKSIQKYSGIYKRLAQ